MCGAFTIAISRKAPTLNIAQAQERKKLWECPSCSLKFSDFRNFVHYANMPRLYTSNFTCPNCGLQAKFSRNTAVVTRKKSAKKQAAGRRLASQLPRDEKGRFLPKGSTNRYKGKIKRSRKGKEPAEGSSRKRRNVAQEDIFELFPDETLL